ncbi:MAG: hypothetical protein F6K23_32205 [Okeania sp. SIO2C9]|uniref:hypothetical protein n=1 Tax=Okeania sp. SIO2C9 TaxID=2607791 RepID=UPI0013C08019|nr:hypothetical protein [Okeania sp. SIO2C9]NEQ77261.1 hypothetical protein [Okeania sp. SIO2C9]
MATCLAVLFADKIYVPAVSYYQSPICRQVIDYYQDIFDLGIISIITDAYSLEEFQDNRLREYKLDSKEYALYKKILDIQKNPPSIYSCLENTTLVLYEKWEQFIKETDIIKIFVKKSPKEFITENLSHNIETLIYRLENQAFIVKNVYPLLFNEPHIGTSNLLLKMICELFFEWFTKKLNSGLVTDLVYLNQLSIKSCGTDLPYKTLYKKLNLEHPHLLNEINISQPRELLILKKDTEWNKVMSNIMA